ncbi:hypothetical protein ASAP_2190 [Asaia bogorensis]|uniref:Uncharacterized protein n=1 Tax=Asaia bogorensis TaxID=91915 RepID=A0A060QH46_9PROT|nr:hypothetical protein ASAP_2190 [Asaia bogorensis]
MLSHELRIDRNERLLLESGAELRQIVCRRHDDWGWETGLRHLHFPSIHQGRPT